MFWTLFLYTGEDNVVGVTKLDFLEFKVFDGVTPYRIVLEGNDVQSSTSQIAFDTAGDLTQTTIGPNSVSQYHWLHISL